MLHNWTRKVMVLVLMFISSSQPTTTENTDIDAADVEELLPNLSVDVEELLPNLSVDVEELLPNLSVVDLQGILGLDKGDSEDIFDDKEVQSAEKAQNKGIPTSNLSLSQSVTEETKIVVPSNISVVDLTGLLGLEKGDTKVISDDKEVQAVEKAQNKGIPTLNLSSSQSVTDETKIDVRSNIRKTPVKSRLTPNRIIYYTTARTVEIARYKVQKTINSQKHKLNPSSSPRQKQNPSIALKQTVIPTITVPSKKRLNPTQKPKTKESPSNSRKTKIVSPDLKETPKSSSQPSEVSKTKTQVLGRFDTNLYQLAKDRNLLSTALKDANPENLEILLAFTKKQEQ